MKPHYVLLAALAASSLIALASDTPGTLSKDWFMVGTSKANYAIGVDMKETSSGTGSKFVRNIGGNGAGWAGLMQYITADSYRSQRLRFKARIKTRDVSNWAGLWMRVDGEKGRLGFYNSQDQPIIGTTDWQWRSVVLDVPANATGIAFGVIDAGKGQVWIDELTLEAVNNTVPVNGFMQPKSKPNL